MIAAWMNYILMLAMIVIAFVGGTKIGRLQEQERQRRRDAGRIPHHARR